MARALIKKIKSDPNPVGSIIESMLDEATFQAEFGNNWVLFDDRSVVGTDYEALTGFSTLADARGQTLRMKNNGRSDGQEDPDGERALGSQQEDAMQQITGSFTTRVQNVSLTLAVGSSGAYSITQDNSALGTMQDGGVQNRRQFINFDSANSPGARTGVETRTKNIAVNYFIKINNEAS